MGRLGRGGSHSVSSDIRKTNSERRLLDTELGKWSGGRCKLGFQKEDGETRVDIDWKDLAEYESEMENLMNLGFGM